MALILTGCAHTAQIQCLQPADVDISAIRRVAVLDLSGAGGETVATVVAGRLWSSEIYDLVEPSDVWPVAQTAATSELTDAELESLLKSARATAVDAVITGSVLRYECREESGPAEGRTGRRWWAWGGSDEESQGVRLAANVEIEFRLIGVEDGETLASRRCRRDVIETCAESPSAADREQLLDDLTQSCVDEFLAVVTPHEIPVEMRLAHCPWYQRGGRQVQRGIKLARQGRWDDAEEQWRKAVERNPGSDAALFNLALAAAHRHDFDAAEDYAMQALRLRHTECYTLGLEEIRRQCTAYQVAQQQRWATGVVPAAAGTW
ncbi:tetratricopeptide repeat protein [Maioricimonas rarisocia]|uniref:tetratricopeptide repeat protein n=1 Tax=Maioricimonas rarisocia TaxID=2528026 RepID=UPI0018D2514D|nr:tetratricopeptide repeat protein [Maioricimonas rarisocia]